MILNTEKTRVMLITSRQKRNNLHEVSFSLQYSDIDIRITTSDKTLGVHVDDSFILEWSFSPCIEDNIILFVAFKKDQNLFINYIGVCVKFPFLNLILIIAVLFGVIHQT